mgnify:CR=1 FL=1
MGEVQIIDKSFYIKSMAYYKRQEDRTDLTSQILTMLRDQHLLKFRDVEHSENVPVHCPFHEDNTPSMFVHKKKGVYKCFSCNRQGSVESLFRKLTHLDAHVVFNIKRDIFTEYSYNPFQEDTGFQDIAKTVSITIQGTVIPIEDSLAGLQYIQKRGITLEVAQAMGMQYTDVALINQILYEHRLLIPIREHTILLSVEGRDVTGTASKKVLYPRNSTINTLFDIDNLKREEPLFVIEGLMDLAVLRTAPEFKNSTAIFGAGVSKRQIALLSQFSKVIYIPDNDAAGLSTLKTFQKYGLTNVQVLKVPSVIQDVPIKDVGDLPQKAGITIFNLVQRKWLKRFLPLEYAIKTWPVSNSTNCSGGIK